MRKEQKCQEALTYHKSALEISISLGKDILEATSLKHIGNAHYAQSEYSEAVKYFDRALEIKVRVLGERHRSVATIINNKAIAMKHVEGQEADALVQIRRSSAIRLALFGDSHPSVATSYYNTTRILEILSRLNASNGQQYIKEAIEYSEKALAIQEHAFGKENPKVALILTTLGSLYTPLRDPKAIAYNLRAVGIHEKLYGLQHPELVTSYYNLATAHLYQRDRDEAIMYYEKALAILVGHPDANASVVKQISDSLETAKKYKPKAKK